MASGKFTWRITNFSKRQSEDTIYSDVFTVGGCNWRLMIYPKGNGVDYLSTYLDVADDEGLPSGWSINAKYSLTLVNQLRDHDSIKEEAQHKFTGASCDWGWKSFKKLTQLQDSSKGYIVNDILVVEAKIEVLNVSPPNVVLETFFNNLEKFFSEGGDSAPKAWPIMKSEAPSLEEVEIAKKSLKECLSDPFKLNIKDRVATSLETLSRAKVGLSSEQQKAIQLFLGEFDGFVLDFLTFEQDNSEFELHKISKDRMFSSIKRNHNTYISNKQLIDDLSKEEEEYKTKMEEARSKKAKLMSASEELMVESVETKTKYTSELKKLKEAEEKKMIAEEKMARSTSAWSSLKSHFI